MFRPGVSSVANVAVPVVSWFPAVFTPGRLILTEPSKDTPPMFLAVASFVAVAALPVQVAALAALPVVF